jgi:bifunctional polynucleotide phosphatase/kinase
MEKSSKRVKEYNFEDSLYILSNKPHPLFKKNYNFSRKPMKRQNYQQFAIFDMDFTLIKTKSGKNYAKDENDWALLFDNVPKVLKEFRDAGFEVIIITNQKLFSTDPEYKGEIIMKIKALFKVFKIPLDFVILSNDNHYRKPSPSCLYFIMSHLYPSVHFDFENSFYCGDAAGRLKTKLRKKDFANT